MITRRRTRRKRSGGGGATRHDTRTYSNHRDEHLCHHWDCRWQTWSVRCGLPTSLQWIGQGRKQKEKDEVEDQSDDDDDDDNAAAVAAAAAEEEEGDVFGKNW